LIAALLIQIVARQTRISPVNSWPPSWRTGTSRRSYRTSISLRRSVIMSGFRSSLSWAASTTASCSQRLMRRSLPVVHLAN
jgi:hypothetical protein